MPATTVWGINPKYPEGPDCHIPLYGVRWTTAKGKPASNAWQSQATAERYIASIEAKGGIITARQISYVGGFAF